jgi:hypothetical protein
LSALASALQAALQTALHFFTALQTFLERHG